MEWTCRIATGTRRNRTSTVSATTAQAQVNPSVLSSQIRTSVRTFSIGDRTPPTITSSPACERNSGNSVWSWA